MRILRPRPGPEDARRRGPAFLLLLLSVDVMAVLPTVAFGLLSLTVAEGRDAAVRHSKVAPISAEGLERLPYDREADSLAPRDHPLPVQRATATRRLTARRDQGGGARRTSAPAERRLVAGGRGGTIAVPAAAVAALPLIVFLAICVTGLIVRPSRRTGDRYDTVVASLAASQDKLRQVADMQGALRRVATLVAHGVSASELFAAVAAEAGHVLDADHAVIVRFESGETADVVAHWNDPRVPQVMPPLNGHWPIEAGTVTAALRNTERAARMNDYGHNTTAIGYWARATGVRCVVGCPVKVEGRVWGALIIHYLESEPPRGVTEGRLQEFVELVGTAIANAQSRSDLLASRARVVAAADESRRRIERDLHDGAQQRLVTLALKLRSVQSAADGPCRARLGEQLGGLVHDLSDILDDLQKVSRGIIPPVLTRSGLSPALRSLARRSTVPVRLDTGSVQDRLPERVEVAVYYTVSEALTNVVKHADASEVHIELVLRHRSVRLSISDDGCGGADFSGGTGLVGLKDRVEALNGRIEVHSPPGDGTTLLVEIPIDSPTARGE